MSTVPNIYDFSEEDDFGKFLETVREESKIADIQESESKNLILDEDDDFNSFIKDVENEQHPKEEEFSIEPKKEKKGKKKDKENQLTIDEVREEIERRRAQEAKKDIPEEAIELGLNFVTEMGLLYIPEGMELTQDNIEQIKEWDSRVRTAAALDYIKSKAGDEAIANLFDLVWNGGTINDLDQASEIVSDEQFLRNLDISDEDTQTYILTKFYEESLNPNSPSYELFKQEIPEKVKSIISKHRGEQEAEKAVEYYLQQIEYAKEELIAERERLELEKAKYEADKVKREHQWQEMFYKELVDKEWSTDKKNEALSNFSTVELRDGTKLPAWDYKMKKIWENPKLTVELFRFLSDLDINTLEFKSTKQNVTNEATNKILQMVSKKAASKTNSANTFTEKKKISDFSDEELGKFIERNGTAG